MTFNELRDHVGKQIKSLQQALILAASDFPDDERIRDAASHALSPLKLLAPVIATSTSATLARGHLNQLEDLLQVTLNVFAKYRENRSGGHKKPEQLKEALDAMETAAPHFAGLAVDLLGMTAGEQLDASRAISAIEARVTSTNNTLSKLEDRIQSQQATIVGFGAMAERAQTSINDALIEFQKDMTTRRGAFDALLKQVDDAHDKAARNFRDKAQEQQAEIESIAQKARETLGLVGIASHARVFGVQAKMHDKSSRRWLLATIAAAALSVAWLAFGPWYVERVFINQSGVSWNTSAYFVYALTSSIIIGTSIYCARVFRAERHNTVLNFHRRNALRAYSAIVAGAEKDSAIREAVVLEVARTIFGQQPTGHLSNEAHGSDTVPLPLVSLLSEIAKSAGPKAGPRA